MSQENVETVRRLFDAWEGGDLAGVLADLDPEMVTNRVHPAPDPRVCSKQASTGSRASMSW